MLERAKALGTRLVVGLNSDESVRKIKGQDRPFLNERERAAVLIGLSAVDEVRIFNEPTPENLIREINPDVLVKGGDWAASEIIGSDLVLQNGGKVFSLPLKEGFSSSNIVEKIRAGHESFISEMAKHSDNSITTASLTEHLEVLQAVMDSHSPIIEECAGIISDVLAGGNKVLICGNGGSAADAQHVAAEFTGRFETERRGLPAIALTTDTSALTAVSNDYGFERAFARQVESLAREGDCLIAISTSGDSPNVTAAVMAARSLGCKVIGFTGAKGKKLASLCDACVMVPSARTCRVQEAHITIFHIICEMIDRNVEDGKL